MHQVEQRLRQDEPNLGEGDSSKCLPGWIDSFCEWFEKGEGHMLNHSSVTALCHTLIAAKVRAERLVQERKDLEKALAASNLMKDCMRKQIFNKSNNLAE